MAPVCDEKRSGKSIPTVTSSATRRAQWSMVMRIAVSVATIAGCAIVAVLTLRGVNRFPVFLAYAEQVQRDGAVVWMEVCKQGTIAHPSNLVRCTDALADSNSSPRKVAIENTLSELFDTTDRALHAHVGSLNPLSWITRNCATGTVCHYVLWKSLDVITSSVFVMTALLLLAIAALVYLCCVWPANGVQRWLVMRRTERDKRNDDPGGRVSMDMDGATREEQQGWGELPPYAPPVHRK